MKAEFLFTFRHRYTRDITRLRFKSYRLAVAYGHEIEAYSSLIDGYTIWQAEFDPIANGWFPVSIRLRKLFTNLPSDMVFPLSYKVKSNLLPNYSLNKPLNNINNEAN